MESTPSLLSSIATCKCPKCRRGNLFAEKVFKRPFKFSQMNAFCPVCGQSFEPEPGFYFGAMFISYALNTALFIAAWIALEILVDDYSIWTLLSLLAACVLVSLPLFFRLSRSVWISIFVRYQQDFAGNKG